MIFYEPANNFLIHCFVSVFFFVSGPNSKSNDYLLVVITLRMNWTVIITDSNSKRTIGEVIKFYGFSECLRFSRVTTRQQDIGNPTNNFAFNQKKIIIVPKYDLQGELFVWFVRECFGLNTGWKYFPCYLTITTTTKTKGYDTFMMMEGKYNKILFIEIIIEAHKINLNWVSFVFNKFLFTLCQ